MSSTDVEVLGADWRKASWSVNNGACVEVASAAEAVLVRDSVNQTGTVIACAPRTWQIFIDATKAGAFGL